MAEVSRISCIENVKMFQFELVLNLFRCYFYVYKIFQVEYNNI